MWCPTLIIDLIDNQDGYPVTHGKDTSDTEGHPSMIHLLDRRFHHATQDGKQFTACKLFSSRMFH